MDPQVLGDYDVEQVTLSFTGLKFGGEIVPTQFAPESRITIASRPRSEVLEGQGGTVVRSRLHNTVATIEIALMPSDPAIVAFAKGSEQGEVYSFVVQDNSGTAQKVTGKAWPTEIPAWNRGRVAEPITIMLTAQIPRNAMQHGTTALV